MNCRGTAPLFAVYRCMKQKNFFKASASSHGGSLSVGKRRSRRSIHTKNSLHIVLRSEIATGSRSLMKNSQLVRRITLKASKRFNVQVYEKAICGNHLHLLIRGKSKVDVQNFFRVLAGHIAQEILRQFPLSDKERGGAPKEKGCLKNRRKFWSVLLFSRVVGWGRDFANVSSYVIQNTLEVLKLIPYVAKKENSKRPGKPEPPQVF